MALAKIRVEPGPGVGRYYIFLNDEDISAYVRGMDISMHVDNGRVPKVTLHFLAELEIADELMANVKVVKNGG